MLGRDAKPLPPSPFSSWQDMKEQCSRPGSIPTCVPDDIVQHHKPLKLQQQLPVGVFREWLGFKPPQPVVSILVAFHKELKGAHLKKGEAVLQEATGDGEVVTDGHGGQQPYFGWQTNAVEALADFRHLLQGQPLPPGLHPVNGTVVKGLAGQIHHLGGEECRCQLGQLSPVWLIKPRHSISHSSAQNKDPTAWQSQSRAPNTPARSAVPQAKVQAELCGST